MDRPAFRRARAVIPPAKLVNETAASSRPASSAARIGSGPRTQRLNVPKGIVRYQLASVNEYKGSTNRSPGCFMSGSGIPGEGACPEDIAAAHFRARPSEPSRTRVRL